MGDMSALILYLPAGICFSLFNAQPEINDCFQKLSKGHRSAISEGVDSSEIENMISASEVLYHNPYPKKADNPKMIMAVIIINFFMMQYFSDIDKLFDFDEFQSLFFGIPISQTTFEIPDCPDG
jgi:hypothetical protein